MTTEDRLYAACWRYVNPTGPAGKAQALNDIRTLVSQLNQEEDPCQTPPSSEPSKPTSSTSPASSATKQHEPKHGSHATTARTRTMQASPAQQPRRSTP